MAILFYLLDMRSIELNKGFSVDMILEVRALIKQIYKNIRTLIRNNPVMRATLNLETKDHGIYIPDVAIGIIDKMVEFCETTGYTTKRNFILAQELNNIEVVLKDILQYYHYFIRPDFRQKPDVDTATAKYKEVADQRTIDELKALVGKRHKIDFENLGTSRIDLTPEVDYDPDIDGEFDSKQLDIDDDDDYDGEME
jgi:hypothetical protein